MSDKHTLRIQSLQRQLLDAQIDHLDDQLQALRAQRRALEAPVTLVARTRRGPTFPMPGSASDRVLKAMPKTGTTTVATLAAAAHLSRPLVSTTLNGLQKRALVKKGPGKGKWSAA